MTTPSTPSLRDTFPPTHRLALAYAPTTSRSAWLGLLALDARLAGVVRAAREPVLGQLRLAWWRERLRENTPPRGEPLLALLEPWGEHRAGLVALVDGWEALLGEAPLDREALSALPIGRGAAVSALALHCGVEADAGAVARLGHGWGLGDLAAHITHPDEQDTVRGLIKAQDWASAPMPRALRPLVVLHGVARGQGQATGAQAFGLGAFLRAMRLGILGR